MTKTTDKETLQAILERLERIEKKVDPPLWRSLLSWVFSNFFTLLALVLIGYVLWQLWAVVITLQEGFDHLQIMVSENVEQAKTGLESLKFWE